LKNCILPLHPEPGRSPIWPTAGCSINYPLPTSFRIDPAVLHIVRKHRMLQKIVTPEEMTNGLAEGTTIPDAHGRRGRPN
ncbi:MAG: hypothetical protein ACK4UZ_12675, partial [Rhizobium rhizophilum]